MTSRCGRSPPTRRPTSSRPSRTAASSAPRRSLASCPSPIGTTLTGSAPWPTPPSTGYSTTPTASSSVATLSGGGTTPPRAQSLLQKAQLHQSARYPLDDEALGGPTRPDDDRPRPTCPARWPGHGRGWHTFIPPTQRSQKEVSTGEGS